jgi:3-dehydroquinate dehydratase/shikimate dehydrogenase
VRQSPGICVTLTATTTAELRRLRDAAVDADLIELRLDGLRDPDVSAALAGRRVPAIVTCRPRWEGGRFDGSEEDRRRLLEQALAEGAEYVDVESRAAFAGALIESDGRRVVLSLHDFARVPADLVDHVRRMRASGAGIVKVAVKARRLSDCLAFLDPAFRAVAGTDAVLIAMGEYGLASRVLAAHFGSLWTYAGALTEVGQVSAGTLLEEYRFRELTPSTGIFGITGSPVAYSVSPAMHNAAFRSTARDAVYLPLPAADFDDFEHFARSVGLQGASVTIPFKVALLERVDEASASAKHVGAVNTVRLCDGRWIGLNTDVDGFLDPLDRRGIDLHGLRASVLGAGGSARAVVIALASRGAEVTVHARRRERGDAVAALGAGRSGAWPPAPGAWDVLVNCTPIGMYPRIDETPVVPEALTGRVVYDLVYNPLDTRLLQDARAAGCRTIEGLDMLVAQAEEEFRCWTGERPPAGVMRDAAVRRLAEFGSDENHLV